MTTFHLVDYLKAIQSEVEFPDFIDLTKGSAIRSMASGDNFVELGLTGDLNVRFTARGADLDVSITSTLNPHEFPTIQVEVSDDEGVPTAAFVEGRIRSLRMLHALAVLGATDRLEEAAALLGEDQDADIEEALIPVQDRLYLSAVGPGSLIMTIVTKTKQGFESAKTVVPLVFKESRELLFARMRGENESVALDNDKKRQDLMYDDMNKTVDLIERINAVTDPRMKRLLIESVSKNMEPRHSQALLANLTTEEEESSPGP